MVEFSRSDLTRPYHAIVNTCGFLLVADNSCVVILISV